jgi:hypothetical protein
MHFTFFHVDPKRRDNASGSPAQRITGATINQPRRLLAKKVATAAIAPIIRKKKPNTM